MSDCPDPNHIHDRHNDLWHHSKSPLVTDDGRPYHDKLGNPIIYSAVSPCPLAQQRLAAKKQEQAQLSNRTEEWWSK